MFMDWKNQYSENEHTTQSNLLIQCNSYQATNGVFQRTRTNSFTICMEIQKKGDVGGYIYKVSKGGVGGSRFYILLRE